MNDKFVKYVTDKLDFKYPEIVEKDLLIHLLLLNLVDDEFFSNNFVFKGGTCLVKCFLGYYRFSEDIDFTFGNQTLLQGRTTSKRKNIVSDLTDKVLELVDKLSHKIGLQFKNDKGDWNYVEFGGNEMRLTLKVYFDSVILEAKSFIKIQVNFFEDLLFPIKWKKDIGNILRDIDKEDDDARLLFQEEYSIFSAPIQLKTYDIREIVSEKMRAMLTRTGIKARDYVDLYFIERKYHTDLDKLENAILDKIRFALKHNDRYSRNFQSKIEELVNGSMFTWGDEMKFLLQDLNSELFYRFVLEIEKRLRRLSNDVK